MEFQDIVNDQLALLEKHKVYQIIEAARKDGWPAVWAELEQFLQTNVFDSDSEKSIFVDLFFTSCVKTAVPGDDEGALWDITEAWFKYRCLPNRFGGLAQPETTVLVFFVLTLREKVKQYFAGNPYRYLCLASEERQWHIVKVWKELFLNAFSPLKMWWNQPIADESSVKANLDNAGITGLMAASMYFPYEADEFKISEAQLADPNLPVCCKAIISFWMLNTPYLSGEERHRQKLLCYAPVLFKVFHDATGISNTFFIHFVEEAMTAYWRVSYIGGDNAAALRMFGDFISANMERLCMGYAGLLSSRPPRQEGSKIRIGYISRMMHKQAVSFYMVNRIIHHSRDDFSVHVFALGDHHDEISELFKQNCDQFHRFSNILDFAGMIRTIIDSDLDLLIYTDIGMDPVTYMLAGLQLVPVQCALVGHGTTTGLRTIQYYLSGDFEAPDADNQYCEQLIRLPNLGAAQYMPEEPVQVITRQELGIPDDAVVFVSCANGIKHGAARDKIFAEILKRNPNAWILLKPFATRSSVDFAFTHRIKAAAVHAGVGDRLIIISPVSGPKSVMGLLSIADIQLDTYPYGGWTTNLEALYTGLPIVTQEGPLSRSRWGAGMLRALGITEGIACNEEKYVDCAVRISADTALRQKIREIIRERTQDVLFNGAGAQAAYEEALKKICKEEQGKEKATYAAKLNFTPVITCPARLGKNDMEGKITIATSLVPGKGKLQQQAVASWRKHGFAVVSVNSPDEIKMLSREFPEVSFAMAKRDANARFGKPYPYFDDILAYFRSISGHSVCGIVNSDVILAKQDLHHLIAQEAANAFVFGSRVEVDSLDSTQGEMYHAGFDFFFFDRLAIPLYPCDEFCLGVPWWDYWAVAIPLLAQENSPAKLSVKKVTNPIAFHVKHTVNWNAHSWLSMGYRLSKYLRPPFELTDASMKRYLQETVTIIHKLAIPISL